jgi:DNA-binding GntR family transcriptional regulator
MSMQRGYSLPVVGALRCVLHHLLPKVYAYCMSFSTPPQANAHAVPLDATLVERLRAMVLTRIIPAGGRMNDVPLAAELGTSRTPLRGALDVLAGGGLLDYAARPGYCLRVPPACEIEDDFKTRAMLEGLAARQAAARQQVRRWHALCLQFRTQSPNPQTKEFRACAAAS